MSNALREQLEEFALHINPGSTNGKHRTAMFDTKQLTELVQQLLQESYDRGYADKAIKADKAIVDAYKRGYTDKGIEVLNQLEEVMGD